MVASDPTHGPDEPLPWSLLPEPPGLTALESAMRDLNEAMQPSTPMVESVRLLESASLGLCDVADRIEGYLPEAEATLTLSWRSRGNDPKSAAAGAAADRMLPGCAASLMPRGHTPRRSTIPTSTTATLRGSSTLPAPTRPRA